MSQRAVMVKSDLNVDKIIQQLISLRGTGGKLIPLHESDVRQLCLTSREIFLEQPMLIELEAPLNIVGDIHGQYDDLLKHFDRCGFPPDANYLFLGDYVDRGSQSLETICLLLAYKIKYPNNFFLLRGNHECASINRIYGFYDECKRRYNIKLWKTFTDCFNCLPVAALIEGTILCMHGGLSPELNELGQIRDLARPLEVPDHGLLCDLLWSDPDEVEEIWLDWSLFAILNFLYLVIKLLKIALYLFILDQHAKEITGWGENDRGVSYTFGHDIVRQFLERHGLSLIVRAHQVVEDGYQFFAKRKLVTVFSAPNYCGEFDNAAAVMIVTEDLTCWFSLLPPEKLSSKQVSQTK